MAEHPAVEFLTAALARAEGTAWAATPGPWEPEGDDPTDDEVYTVHDGEHGDLVGNPVAYVRSGMWAPDPGRTQANMQLIASHADPAAVLRRVAVDRQLLHGHKPVRGTAYTEYGLESMDKCALCDARNDANRPWPCRTVRLLAEGWGWVS